MDTNDLMNMRPFNTSRDDCGPLLKALPKEKGKPFHASGYPEKQSLKQGLCRSYVRDDPREQGRAGLIRQGRRKNQDEVNYRNLLWARELGCTGEAERIVTEAPGTGEVIN